MIHRLALVVVVATKTGVQIVHSLFCSLDAFLTKVFSGEEDNLPLYTYVTHC